MLMWWLKADTGGGHAGKKVLINVGLVLKLLV